MTSCLTPPRTFPHSNYVVVAATPSLRQFCSSSHARSFFMCPQVATHTRSAAKYTHNSHSSLTCATPSSLHTLNSRCTVSHRGASSTCTPANHGRTKPSHTRQGDTSRATSDATQHTTRHHNSVVQACSLILPAPRRQLKLTSTPPNTHKKGQICGKRVLIRPFLPFT